MLQTTLETSKYVSLGLHKNDFIIQTELIIGYARIQKAQVTFLDVWSGWLC